MVLIVSIRWREIEMGHGTLSINPQISSSSQTFDPTGAESKQPAFSWSEAWSFHTARPCLSEAGFYLDFKAGFNANFVLTCANPFAQRSQSRPALGFVYVKSIWTNWYSESEKSFVNTVAFPGIHGPAIHIVHLNKKLLLYIAENPTCLPVWCVFEMLQWYFGLFFYVSFCETGDKF